MLTSSTMRRDKGACNMKYKYNNYLNTSRPSVCHQVSIHYKFFSVQEMVVINIYKLLIAGTLAMTLFHQ